MDDFLDPNTWDILLFAPHEHRIYLDDTLEVYAIVDEIDYAWAVQWRWCAKRDPNGKVYARRAQGVNRGGKRLKTFTVYLHVEIMKRMRKRRKSKMQVLVDHRNGRSLDCRRDNLRHATYQQNNANLFGIHYHQAELGI